MLERFHAAERLGASKLNRMVDAINALNRNIGRANDAGDWVPCIPTVDAPAYSILGAYNSDPQPDGLYLMIEDVEETSELLVANEDYPLKAGEKGWCKIINSTRPCLVNSLSSGIVFLSDLNVIDQSVVTVDTVISGTGTGSSDPGIEPLASLFAISAENDDARVWVMASRVSSALVRQFVLVDTTAVVVGGDNVTAQCYMIGANRESFLTDAEYTVDLGAVDGIIFPPLGSLSPACIITAVQINGVWCGIDGGYQAVMGARTASGVQLAGQPDVPASTWCDELIPNGTENTLAMLVNGSPLILGACCGGTGTGTGS